MKDRGRGIIYLNNYFSDRSFKNGVGEEFQWKIDWKLYVNRCGVRGWPYADCRIPSSAFMWQLGYLWRHSIDRGEELSGISERRILTYLNRLVGIRISSSVRLLSNIWGCALMLLYDSYLLDHGEY